MLDRIADVMEFRSSLNAESDRGCALMAAAFLDAELDLLLRSVVVDNSKIAEELFGQARPISTFSSRIDLAYLLGLISSNTRRDLHLIRKVRNEFGHQHRPLTFEDQAISGRCFELKHHFRSNEEGPRKVFASSAVACLAMLHTAATIRPRPIERSEPDLISSKELGLELESVLTKMVEEASKSAVDDT